jgi:hypothetical protein
MSDRNLTPPYRPREAELFAELSDLLGDGGSDVPHSAPNAQYEPLFDPSEGGYTEAVYQGAGYQETGLQGAGSYDAGSYDIAAPQSTFASVDANYPIRPREVALAGAPAAPLVPRPLDAWDLRPALDDGLNNVPNNPQSYSAPGMAMSEVEAAHDDMFQSVFDGLEDEIVVEAETPPVAGYAGHEIQSYAHGGAVFDPLMDFEAAFAAPARSAAAAEQPQLETGDVEPEFEDFDFDFPLDEALEAESAEWVAPAVAAAPIATGTMRANGSRETHAETGHLPAVPAASDIKMASAPVLIFPDVVLPYDDVPVTGSLNVPEFVAAEDNNLKPAAEYDDFDMDDFHPAGPVESAKDNAGKHAAIIVHEPSKPDNVAANERDVLADVDFDDVFAHDFSAADELAAIVGSNIEPDPLMMQTNADIFGDTPTIPPMEPQPPRGRRKWVALGALGIALVGALAVYGVSLDGSDDGSEPVVVRADIEPVRVAPDNPGGTVVPNQDRVVFNEVDGSNPVPETPQEALVDGRQEPAIAGSPAKEEDRVLNGDASAEPDAGNGAAIAPRAVQTVTVRPDGSLVIAPPVETADAAPQPQIVPEARPENLPEIQQENQAAQAMPEAQAAAPTPEPVQEPAQEPADATAQAGVPVRVVDLAPVVQKPKPVAPAPVEALDVVPSRPSDQPVDVVNGDAPAPSDQPAGQGVAATEPAPLPAAGSYAIQIASQPNEEAAMASLRSLSSKFGSVLAGKDYAIQRAEVPGKGTFYRVRILAGSKDDAGKLCARYKSAGGSCFVTR